MKLRIQDNFIRIRLTISELQELGEEKETFMVSYIGVTPLITRLVKEEGQSSIEYHGEEIVIRLNSCEVDQFCKSNDEGLYKCMQVTDEIKIKLAIEKDFKCVGRTEISNQGLFPNPKGRGC